MKISVIVTNFNGLKLLKKNLIHVYNNSPEANQIIVSDDASTDKSLNYLKSIQNKYSKLEIISHKKNIGFAANSNSAVKASNADLVVLFNNDIKPIKGYVTNSLKHFKDPLVFGVGFAEIGHENWGKIYWSQGYIQYQPGLDIKTSHISGWLSGGSSMVRKSLFTKLGGFDKVYQPFYSEDLDLGFRAWKSGYKLIWEPSAKVYHKHEGTMSKFPKRHLDYVKERNRLLTVWRNIQDPKMLMQNKLAIVSRCFFGPNYLKIIRAAKKQIKKYPPPIVFPKLTDRQVFEKFK